MTITIIMIDPYKGKAIVRLKKVKGQIDGIIKMIEEGRYCIDIFTQSLALQGSIKGVNSLVLESHLKTCGNKLSSKDTAEREKFIKELVRTCELSNR